ncbi:MAG TPA: protein kinase [Anaerolineales bacterium]|nr:protein kinase [Anaerolineales bacterium]
MPLEIGTLLHKRYRIVEDLAQGGMGSVYAAMDENLGILVAVKENLFTTDEYARQFRLEAIILANLRHPNLPRVSDHFTVAGQGQYLVMDYIEGEDLRQRMERVGSLSEDEVITIGAAICDALTYLHTRKPPILHRDIKPGNIKITPDGHIVLVDFGLAKVVQGDQATTVGARAMTPGYSPPEQYGTARTDPRTDIYSLGATLYAIVSGVIPEDGLARAMDNEQLAPLRKRSPNTSRKLAVAIEKAMAVDPMDRYQTAKDFKQALLESKSRTQQPEGAYIIEPPPSAVVGEVIDVEKSKSPVLVPASSLKKDEPAFISPRKKQILLESRVRRTIIGVLLAILVLGFFGVNYFYPGLLSLGAQRLFSPASADQTFAASVATSTLIPENSPTSQPEAVFSSPVPPNTQTPIPTPLGSEDLEIAFASTRAGVAQIYVSDLQGHIRQLTHMNEGACQPSWAPDGSKLVFISPCKVQQDIYRGSSMYLINYDGTGLEHLTTVPGGDFEPDWSPDVRHIAFTSVRTGNMQIYSYDLDTGLTTRLIRTPRDEDARQPAWSPDGKQIAFALRRGDKVYQIWLMSNDGRDPVQLVRSGDRLSDTLPEWSPDGKLILFDQTPTDKFAFPSLFMIPLEPNSDPVKLNMGVLSINNVSYSSDGFWLAFENVGEHGSEVYYMTVTGAQKTNLTNDLAGDFDPAWRPTPK